MSDGGNHQFERTIKNFFVELNPALKAAQKLDREMNRIFAHRFNVLDYLRTDELGLSRIIADLFNPSASHGQGTFFLDLFLRKFLENKSQTRLDSSWLDFKSKDVRVKVEQTIENDRRIDIYVTIKRSDAEVFCLAIENKPYTGDQGQQIADYLKHLEGKFGENFLLIYLPARGQMPSEYSLGSSEYKKWEGRFKIMAYCTGNESIGADSGNSEPQNDEKNQATEQSVAQYEKFQLPFSLINWLSGCRTYCEVDRLRWFLRETEQFCGKRFGGQSMANDGEIGTVEEFVFSDPKRYLKTANLISDSWPHIRSRVCSGFFDHLAEIVKEKMEENQSFGDDIEVRSDYGDGIIFASQLFAFRKSWKEYTCEGGSQELRTTKIALNNQSGGPRNWIVGVCSPLGKPEMNESDKGRRQLIEDAIQSLPGRTTDWWPRYQDIEISMRDWNKIVPELQAELDDRGGKITDYFVNKFLEIAKIAIPIIDKEERHQDHS